MAEHLLELVHVLITTLLDNLILVSDGLLEITDERGKLGGGLELVGHFCCEDRKENGGKQAVLRDDPLHWGDLLARGISLREVLSKVAT